MIAHTYKNMSPKDLESFSALVTSRLENNPIFASIKEAALLDLSPAHKALSKANLDYDTNGGGGVLRDLREKCRLDLVKELYLSSVQVEALAKTDAEIISASGYVLLKTTRAKIANKEPNPVKTPINFVIANVKNKPGFVNLSWSRVTGSRLYSIQKRAMGTTEWLPLESTTNTLIELGGFEPNTVMEFCVRTHGLGEMKSEYTAPEGILIK
jgi:hypothetical protein